MPNTQQNEIRGLIATHATQSTQSLTPQTVQPYPRHLSAKEDRRRGGRPSFFAPALSMRSSRRINGKLSACVSLLSNPVPTYTCSVTPPPLPCFTGKQHQLVGKKGNECRTGSRGGEKTRGRQPVPSHREIQNYALQSQCTVITSGQKSSHTHIHARCLCLKHTSSPTRHTCALFSHRNACKLQAAPRGCLMQGPLHKKEKPRWTGLRYSVRISPIIAFVIPAPVAPPSPD